MKTVAVLLLALAGSGLAEAQGYFGVTTVDTGNLDIVVQSFRHGVAAVGLVNRSGSSAQCEATFSNGAQFSETRSTTIAPGKRATLAYSIHTITPKVDIAVRCRAV